MNRKRKQMLISPLFGVAIIALLMLHAYNRHTRSELKTLDDKRDQAIAQLAELEALAVSHENKIRDFEKDLSDIIEVQAFSDKAIQTVFDNEFLVFNNDILDGSGSCKTNVRVYVPSKGQHRIRIEIWLRKERLWDDFFQVDSGNCYDILFDISSEAIEINFPGHELISSQLNDFDLQFGSKSLGRPRLFVSPNQAPWRKGVAFFDESRVGVLSEFRFHEKITPESFLRSDAVSVRISAESTGPMTAAADDPLTITRMIEMAQGLRKPMPYRYENGRYVFE